MDSFEVKWERNYLQLATFVDNIPPSFNNYTVTGLSESDNATYIITVTAINGAGMTSSVGINLVANFAASGRVTRGREEKSDEINEGLITGVVVAGVVIIAIALVIVIFLIVIYKTRSRQGHSKKPVYSLVL